MHTRLLPEQRSSVAMIQLVLRDMGNGVTRIENCFIFPTHDPDCGFAGSIPLLFPLTPKVQDAVDFARSTLLECDLPDFDSGRFRSITPR
jgi:hypothetical protein